MKVDKPVVIVAGMFVTACVAAIIYANTNKKCTACTL
jgi:hypothetical protein